MHGVLPTGCPTATPRGLVLLRIDAWCCQREADRPATRADRAASASDRPWCHTARCWAWRGIMPALAGILPALEEGSVFIALARAYANRVNDQPADITATIRKRLPSVEERL